MSIHRDAVFCSKHYKPVWKTQKHKQIVIDSAFLEMPYDDAILRDPVCHPHHQACRRVFWDLKTTYEATLVQVEVIDIAMN